MREFQVETRSAPAICSQFGRNKMKWGFRELRTSARVAALAIIGISTALGAPIANGLGSAKPTLIEDKFDVPTDQQTVTQEWISRGFSRPTVEIFPRGWGKDEHAYPYSLLITLIAGRMEFIIADQRVVIEPGDELYYPGRAVMLARNIHDGDSRVLISRRR